MKLLLLLPVTIVVSVALMTVMKTRETEEATENKQNMFVDIKLRVTTDVLNEYEKEKSETRDLLEKGHRDFDTLEEEVNTLWAEKDKAKNAMEKCKGEKKILSDEIALKETDLKELQDIFIMKKADWETEVETLKKQLAARSSVCEFVSKGSLSAASALCGTEGTEEARKEQEPKAEAPKQEEPKVDAPEQEEPRAEVPKQEEPKAEAPKQEVL